MPAAPEPERLIKLILTGIALISSVIFLIILVFPWVGILTSVVSGLLGITQQEYYIIVDAILTFLVVFLYFFFITLITRIHSYFVIVFSAISMFLIWGWDSGFFGGEISRKFPMWYEIKMATNDLIAALVVVIIHKHISKKIQPTTRSGS